MLISEGDLLGDLFVGEEELVLETIVVRLHYQLVKVDEAIPL